MPNNIKNRIEIIGSKEDVKDFFNKFNTHHDASLSTTHDDNEVICKKTTGEGRFDYNVGWFNLKTGMFRTRTTELSTGIGEGFAMEISEAWDRFPDFEKVFPPPKDMFRGNLSDEDKRNCIQKGIANWYDWQRQNWGTK